MTQQEMMLIRRTAWMNIRLEENPALRPPKQRERDDLITAMYMLAYIGAIDMCLYDLVDELTEAGLYRHALKKQINHIMRTVAYANGQANEILQKVNDGKRVRQYTDMFEYTYREIQEHVLLQAPERAYNIVRALTRLFVEAFDAVGIRTRHIYLRDAAEVLKRLEIPQIQDHNIDVIIQRNVEIVLPD
jgi:hypothetical protein